MKRLLTIVTVLACLVGTNKPLSAQIEALGGGLGGGSTLSTYSGLGERVPLLRGQYAQSGNVVLLLSQSGDAVWGFSTKSGKWAKQPLAPAAEKIEGLMLGNEVGGFQIGRKVYAFSGSACRWDTLQIPKGDYATLQVIPGAELFIAQVGSYLFVFSPQTGRWVAPETTDGKPHTVKTKEFRGMEGFGGAGQGGQPSIKGIGALRVRAIPRSVELARQIQQLRASDGDASKRAQLEAQLRQAVAEEFKERQQRQQHELDRLKERLERIEQMIDAREKAKDEIINRRIEELLNPILRWDGESKPSAHSAPGTASAGASKAETETMFPRGTDGSK